MALEPDLPGDLDQLQKRYQALQADYLALALEKQQQEAASRQWLEQRTRELEAEALEQKKAETLQRVFYRIAERAAADLSFYDFLQSVHALLGELLYAKNCYVCLYDAQEQRKDFPYYVDERDGDALQLSNVPLRRGLTEFVLRTAQPQIIDAHRLQLLQANGEVTEGSGDMSFSSWLGVPMHIRGATGGVLAVQGYEPGVQYSASDAGILSFVANHVSSAIERYQALDELRKSEERYRTVIEKVGVGVVVVQDARMVFANPSLVRIVGHPLDYLLSQPFNATVHPDDMPAMVERHERRLRGEPVESMYGFRVVTQQGEVRSLEMSAVKIEWSKRDATLIFVVDATARLQAEQTMRLTLQRQTEINDMKSRFISVASHEFRTPLAFILSSAELLKYYGNRLPEAEKQEVISTIENGVQRMTGMLDRVLLLGKVEAEMLEFKPR
ncbi:MAG: PAS domain S-box protein, partial [Polaromonas sp.]|nr:PAS domain S-box protein [Polaromonas sp.]